MALGGLAQTGPRLPLAALVLVHVQGLVACLWLKGRRVGDARSHKRSAAAGSAQQWAACAAEGDLLPLQGGAAKFGFGESWVEAAALLPGSPCAASSFGGVDPMPGVRKQCLCARGARGEGQQDKEELGTAWWRCASEGGRCECPGSRLRFGAGSRWVPGGASALAGQEQSTPSDGALCDASAFVGADPSPEVSKECWCQRPDPRNSPLAQGNPGIGIVLLTRHPPEFPLWLAYHIGHSGIGRVFVTVEDTPEFNATLNAVPESWLSRIKVTRTAPQGGSGDSRPENDYESLQRRQVLAMQQAKDDSASDGDVDWLVHIDDDELLYAPTGRSLPELLGSVPIGIDMVHIPNVEAAYPSAGGDCFTETTQANADPYKFVSYANGKVAVRVSVAGAVPAGPHLWRDSTGAALPALRLDSLPFGAPLMVVHYESCPFSRWKDKYWELANTPQKQIAKIPFPFYRESITRMQQCVPQGLRAGAASLEANAATPEGCSEDELRRLWASWKSVDSPRLRPGDLMPVRIPWAAVAAQLRPAIGPNPPMSSPAIAAS